MLDVKCTRCTCYILYCPLAKERKQRAALEWERWGHETPGLIIIHYRSTRKRKGLSGYFLMELEAAENVLVPVILELSLQLRLKKMFRSGMAVVFVAIIIQWKGRP